MESANDIDDESSQNTELEKLRNNLREAKLAYREQQREFMLKKARFLLDDQTSQNISQDELKKIAVSLRSKSQVSCESLNMIMNALLDSKDNITAFLSVDGALQALLRALSGQNEKFQLIAARCICNLAFGSEKLSLQVLKAAESYLFAHLSGRNCYIKEACGIAIGNFSRHGSKHIQLLIDQGFFPKITHLLNNPDENLEEAAIYALTQLIYHGFDVLTVDRLQDSLLATITIFKKRSFSAAFLMSLFSAHKDCHRHFLRNDIHVLALKCLLISLKEDDKEALAYLRIVSNCISDSSGKMTRDLIEDHSCVFRDCIRCLLQLKKGYLQKECLALIGNLLNHPFEMFRPIAKAIVSENLEVIQLILEQCIEGYFQMIT